MADGSCNRDGDVGQLHTNDDGNVINEREHTGGTYKLRDSRYNTIIGTFFD